MGTDLIYSTGNSQHAVNLQIVTMTYSNNEWEDFLLKGNIFFKLPEMGRFWRHDLWTSHKQEE
jgi:hypothetical protein